MKPALILKALLALAALAFLIHYVDPSAMAAAAAGADPFWIAAAFLLMPCNVLLEGFIWHRMIRHVSSESNLRDHYGALLAGYALGFFTPGSVGEFAGRAFYIRHEDRWEIAAVVFAQRLLDSAVGTVLGTVALLFFLDRVDPQPESIWGLVLALGTCLGVVLTAAASAPSYAHRILRRVIPFEAIKKRIQFLGRLSSRDGRELLGLDFFRYLVFSTQLYFLLRALVPGADPVTAFIGIALVFFAKILLPPVTFLDVGIREGAAVFFLGSLGFSEAAALNAALMLFGMNVIVPAALGVPLVMRLRLERSAPDAG